MPFVLRQVTPVRLSRLPNDGPATAASSLSADDPRQCITNQTLSACLRQLASLVSLASDIFTHCQDEASVLHERTVQLRQRLDRLQTNADRLDSRTVPIPEGDLAAFSHDHKTNHFKSSDAVPAATSSSQVPELKLLTSENRPKALVALYDKAASLVTPPAVNRPDSLMGVDGMDAADYGRLMALGATLRRRRKHRSNVLEIETRRPASLAHMREWLTDDEAVLDDLSAPVGPDNRCRIDNDHATDSALHRLPSPEEKAKAAASQVFTAEVVRLDVTGSGFERMTQFRRSLQHFEYAEGSSSAAGTNLPERSRGRKRSKKKSSSKKRRNTIACDGDRRDIQDALGLGGRANASSLTRNDGEKSGSRSSLRQRLNLVHLLRTSLMTTPSTGKASGSAVTSSDLSYDESDNTMQSITTDATSHASSELVVQVTAGNLVTATRTRSGAMMNTISRLRRLGTDHTFVSGPVQADIHPAPISTNAATNADPNTADSDLYELIPSEKEFGTLGAARPLLRNTVKLRSSKESTDGRSSSGNWSASGSSCSTRASLDSDHPRHQHHLSAASPLAQRHPRVIQQHQQRSFSPEMDVDSALSGDDCSATTTSSIHRPDENGHHNHNELDMETSSVYSCDAEGYYTSFHIDSGLKTLKEGQSDGSLHQNRPSANKETSSATTNGSDSNRSSGMSSASGSITGGMNTANGTTITENEYELFGKGSTLSNTTTSSAGTVIFRPDGTNGTATRKKRNSQPPEPPPRNGSNRNSTTSATVSLESVDSSSTRKPERVEKSRQLTETESKEIADALKQLRCEDSDTTGKSEASEEASRERIRAKTQIERIPAMCVVTPSVTPLPSDDDHEALRSPVSSLQSHIQSAFLQHVANADVRPAVPRVNVADLPAPPPSTETPIVIKASVVKCPADQELVALSQLPTADAETTPQPFSSAGSSESSRSSSLERKKRGARVTLDSEGKVVYSSDSLKRRKAQAGHTTFEPGQQVRKLDPGTSAFRPNPIGSTTKPLSPPPYRPAPTFTGSIRTAVRTQPDGQTAQQEQRSAAGSPASNAAVSRSDSYRLANEDDVDNSDDVGSFQRNRSDSYRRANQTLSVASPAGRLGSLSNTLSGYAVNGRSAPLVRPMTTGTGQYITGHLGNGDNNGWARNRSASAQPMSYTIKSPMLVKQISNPNFTGQITNGGQNGRAIRQYPSNHSNVVNLQQQQQQQRQFYNRQISSPAMMMMTSSPLPVKQSVNPNVAGRRSFGGPRLMVNPKVLSAGVNHNNNKSGSISSLNSSGGSGIDISMMGNKKLNGFHSVVPPSPVVRPPSSMQDRPSFFNTPDGAGALTLNGDSSGNSPLPGYQSLSPPPRMSALPLAQLSGTEFQRKDFRYNSLPARFKTAADYYASLNGRSSVEPDYNLWLPNGSAEKNSTQRAPRNGGRDSPEEGGFLEYNNNSAATRQQGSSSSNSSTSSNSNVQHGSSPTPSFSSCSLDGSFASSLNDSADVRPGSAWPLVIGSPHPPGMKVQSVGLIKRTTISDFKRKLLELHHPAQKKISAVEQLKTTKPPPGGMKGPSPDVSPVTKHPALENFIRRSARVSYIASRLSQQQRNNRFQHSPRTDVLSSTIAEGRSEEELAAEKADDTVVESPMPSNGGGGGVRRHLSFQHPRRGSSTPSSGSSTPIETSL